MLPWHHSTNRIHCEISRKKMRFLHQIPGYTWWLSCIGCAYGTKMTTSKGPILLAWLNLEVWWRTFIYYYQAPSFPAQFSWKKTHDREGTSLLHAFWMTYPLHSLIIDALDRVKHDIDSRIAACHLSKSVSDRMMVSGNRMQKCSAAHYLSQSGTLWEPINWDWNWLGSESMRFDNKETIPLQWYLFILHEKMDGMHVRPSFPSPRDVAETITFQGSTEW